MRRLKGKKILITGGTGFVGSNIARQFCNDNDIHLVVRPGCDMVRVRDVIDEITVHLDVSLCDVSALGSLCENLCPHVVIHCAAYGTRPYKLGVPFQTDLDQMVETNVKGTINLMRACEHVPLDAFINLGSSSEYGTKCSAMSEDDLVEPITLYGASKASATLFLSVLARKAVFAVYSLRLFAVYGLLEEKSRLIPSILSNAVNNNLVSLSSPHPVRDYVYVDDIARAIDILVASRAASGIYNVCTGKQWSIAEVVRLLEDILGRELKVSYGSINSQPDEPKAWFGNPDKLLSLGWKPRTLRDGIADMLARNGS